MWGRCEVGCGGVKGECGRWVLGCEAVQGGKCLGVQLGLGVSMHPLSGAVDLGEQILGLYLPHPLPSVQPLPATHLYCRHRPRWPIAT